MSLAITFTWSIACADAAETPKYTAKKMTTSSSSTVNCEKKLEKWNEGKKGCCGIRGVSLNFYIASTDLIGVWQLKTKSRLKVGCQDPSCDVIYSSNQTTTWLLLFPWGLVNVRSDLLAVIYGDVWEVMRQSRIVNNCELQEDRVEYNIEILSQ